MPSSNRAGAAPVRPPLPQQLKTINTVRRGYGRRYTYLPVDLISNELVSIDCREAYLPPERYDLQVGDLVYWREGERYIEATLTSVEIRDQQLELHLRDAKLMPEEFFPF